MIYHVTIYTIQAENKEKRKLHAYNYKNLQYIIEAKRTLQRRQYTMPKVNTTAHEFERGKRTAVQVVRTRRLSFVGNIFTNNERRMTAINNVIQLCALRPKRDTIQA